MPSHETTSTKQNCVYGIKIKRKSTSLRNIILVPQMRQMVMLILNPLREYRMPLDLADAETLGLKAATEAERFLSFREHNRPTPLHALSALARKIGVRAIHIKDEGLRLGLGSFKALGGSYAVIRLVLEAAERAFGRPVDVDELHSPAVRAIAATMTFSCATDGNHGRSVASGSRLVGANAAIFIHSSVSDERAAAIGRLGAEVIRVEGNYDDSVSEASRLSAQKGWIVVSDTSWPGYEHAPRLVMQGYTAMVREALHGLSEPPTHIFMQAGVGGLAAAVAGHFSLTYGDARPTFVVVEPTRAACIFESARDGYRHRIAHGEATIMAMLECYEPSMIAWRVLSRVADAFMTVEEEDAVSAMNYLARPVGGDPAIVAGESGGVGLAGLLRVAGDSDLSTAVGLTDEARIFVINTEGATDHGRYLELVGLSPDSVQSAPPIPMLD
jgi:diaminopropionate ammonia-lyase